MARYTMWNCAMPTTAAPPKYTLTTAIRTLIQLKPFNTMEIVEWGVFFFGSAAGVPIQCELLETGTIFGTVTAYVDADIMKFDGQEGAVASIAGLTLGTATSGYTASAEGTITATRVFDYQGVAPTNQYIKQFPLGERPKLVIGNCTRIRVTAPVAVDVNAYLVLNI